MSERAVALAFLVACGARTELDGRTVTDGGTADLTPDFAWYKLDETSGTTAHDSSPHHRDIVIGGVEWNDGAIFDGGRCGSTDVDAAFRVPPVTIAAWLTPWARSDETLDAYALTPFPPDAVSGDVPAAGGFGLGLDVWTDGGGGRAIAVETGANADVAFHTEPGAFASGDRHFFALVIGAGGAEIWVDGALDSQVSDDVPPAATPAPLHLGCHNDDPGSGSKRFFEGRLRDVRIYKRELGDAEIAQLFANGPV